jgi:hypothetical protein
MAMAAEDTGAAVTGMDMGAAATVAVITSGRASAAVTSVMVDGAVTAMDMIAVMAAAASTRTSRRPSNLRDAPCASRGLLDPDLVIVTVNDPDGRGMMQGQALLSMRFGRFQVARF